MRGNPQLSALALLVRKFGTKIPGGGYEVLVSAAEMMQMSPHGTFQEVPDQMEHGVRWQYFPNPTIEGVGGIIEEPVAPESGKTLSCGCEVGNCICDIET